MNKYLKKLEFDKILQQINELCITENAKKMALEINPIDDFEELNQTLDEVDEALKLICRLERVPFYFSNDLSPIFQFVKKGGILDGTELYEIFKYLKTIKANKLYLEKVQKENIEVNYYQTLVTHLFFDSYLFDLIDRSIEESGYVKDEASTELKSIRKRLTQIDIRIKNKIQELLGKEASKLSFNNITMRDGHYCLPVKAEYKNSFKGNILDVSTTNQTIYIEPIQIIELTTLKNELIQAEKEEVEKILRAISKDVEFSVEDFIMDYPKVIKLDLIFSKAVLALKQNAARVKVNQDNVLELISARHPLLNVEKVIPNDIIFGNNLGIIITGPNTGGKTVLLKTVGLLSIMTKCGLLIPANEKSNVFIFDQVFCDIGDEQSIENNLSTFSSHMGNIINIINNVSDNSLVILDEIGSGTDPVEGTNLAIAILDYFVSHNISFLVTTHYSDLKTYAYQSQTIENASMEFDIKTLKPTYHLRMGIPGSSNALEISERLGLNKEIVENAKKKVAIYDDEVKNLIKKLEYELQISTEKNKQLDNLIEEEKEKERKLDNQLKKFENDKDIMLKKHLEKASAEVNKLKEEALSLIDELKSKEASSVKLHEAINYKKQIDDLNITEQKEKPKVVNNQNVNFVKGEDVYLPNYDQYGYIINIEKNHYTVSIGNVIMELKKSDLMKVEKNTKEQSSFNIVKDQSKSVSLRCDLRGLRIDEAKDVLEKYFDDIMLNNIKQFSIIHGYGTGAIRNFVQDFLKKAKGIDKYRYGVEGEGGMGVTVVYMK